MLRADGHGEGVRVERTSARMKSQRRKQRDATTRQPAAARRALRGGPHRRSGDLVDARRRQACARHFESRNVLRLRGRGHQHSSGRRPAFQHHGRRRNGLLHRLRPGTRNGAMEVGRGSRRDDARQGHHDRRQRRAHPIQLTNVNGTLFFSANDGTNGHELWKSDGTAAGTVLVKDINPAPATATREPDQRQRHAVLHGRRRHVRQRAVEDRRHRRRHRARSRTSTPASRAATPRNLTNVNGTLFFTANDGTHGSELWKSDGTAAGTVLVKDINPGASRLLPDHT